jgi:WD40 repeat protein
VTIDGHEFLDVHSIAFSSDGRKLFSTAVVEAMVRVWDSSNGRPLQRLLADKYLTRALAVSPDGRRIASVGSDQAVKLWDASTGQQLITLRGHQNEIRAVAFSPDGRLIASADDGGVVRIWDGSPWDGPAAAPK